MRGILFLGLSLALISPSEASFEEKPPSARAAGMGEAMTAVTGDTNSLFYNPAGLRFSRHREFSSSYTRLFALSELPYNYFAIGLPTEKAGAWGLSFGQFGPSIYREQDFGVTHSLFLSPDVAFGYTLKRSTVKLRRYGSASAFGLDAGIVGQFHPKFRGGFSARNINHPNLGGVAEGPAQEFRGGISFRPAPGFLTAVDLVKSGEADLSYRAGQEIQLAPALAVRFGVETEPNRYSAGFGLRLKGIHLDYAFLSHPFLHEQQHVSLAWWWGPEEEVEVAQAAAKAKKKSARKKKTAKGGAPAGPEEKVNLNAATLDDLMTLPGIGRVMAQSILDYRKQNGPFQQELDLLNVPRFQRRIFIRVRPYIVAGPAGETPEAPAAPVPPAEEAPAEAGEEEEPVPEEPEEEAEEEEEAADGGMPAPAVPPAPVPPPAPAPEPESARPERSQRPAGPAVNINAASTEELERAGLTSIQAKNVVRYRQRKGPFGSVDDLREVPGITQRNFEALRERLSAD